MPIVNRPFREIPKEDRTTLSDQTVPTKRMALTIFHCFSEFHTLVTRSRAMNQFAKTGMANLAEIF